MIDNLTMIGTKDTRSVDVLLTCDYRQESTFLGIPQRKSLRKDLSRLIYDPPTIARRRLALIFHCFVPLQGSNWSYRHQTPEWQTSMKYSLPIASSTSFHLPPSSSSAYLRNFCWCPWSRNPFLALIKSKQECWRWWAPYWLDLLPEHFKYLLI